MMQTEKPTTFKRSGKKGMPPGSLIHVGSTYTDTAGFTCHNYSTESWVRESDQKKISSSLISVLEFWVVFRMSSEIREFSESLRKRGSRGEISDNPVT